MHRPPPEATQVVAENRRTYDRLVEIVAEHARVGDQERVLRSASLAAAFAWWGPTGLLSDPVLERLVVDAVACGERPVVDGGRATGRVLHVLSEGYDVGGHTRLVWRWIARDSRIGDVALTNQLCDAPSELAEAVRAAGGELHDLRTASTDLLGRALALRALFDDVDLVVLHVHPYDAVALAAVNLPGPRPPVVLLNHADHAFWLGVGAADVVANIRTWSRLSTELRGIASDRLAVLPLPIEAPEQGETSVELRRRLGIAPDAVVGVTVASAAKTAAVWGRGMAPLLDRALAWNRQLVVVVVGPQLSDEWKRLTARHPGRLFAVGPVVDIGSWYALADVYLESYPSHAGTSVLEAALAGKPVVTLEDFPLDAPARTFQAASPGMAEMPRASTPEQYIAALRRLVDDPELRTLEGGRAQRAVQAVHCGASWIEALEQLVAQARAATAVDLAEHPGRIDADGYAAMLAAFMDTARPLTALTVDAATRPLGDVVDAELRSDVFAVLHRDRGATLTVRVASGWEEQPDWTTRLLALAGEHARLALSLPFAAADDRAGSRSTAVLVSALARIGQTPEDCGTVSVETQVPAGARLTLPGELPCTDEALSELVGLLASSLWTPADAAPRTGTPV